MIDQITPEKSTVQGFVQGVVQGSVQGKHPAVIGLCRVCRGFTHAPARVNVMNATCVYTTLARVANIKNPCTPCTRLMWCAFSPAQTPAQHPAHPAQNKK
jgi:hypothetical protein